MYFYLIGIDYKTSPISVRGEVWRNKKEIAAFWAVSDPSGSAVLATCNRIEIYGTSKNPDEAFGHIAAFSKKFPLFAGRAYLRYGEKEVFRHALRLGSGLESQIKGEAQILTQLDAWIGGSAMPLQLETLWRKAVSLSGKIRKASKLDDERDNIAAIIYDDIPRRAGPKDRYEILVIGTGKVAQIFAGYRLRNVHIAFAAHKNFDTAKALASASGGETVLLKDLPQALAKADVVISATSSPHHILKREHFELRQKVGATPARPIYIYDLAVPRDVEPAVARISNVTLLNLDDLDVVFYRHNSRRQERLDLARDLIEDVLGVYREVIHGKSP